VVVPCEGEFQTPVALDIPGVTGSLYGPWQFENQLFFSVLNGSEENIVTATRSAAGVYSAPIQVLNVNSGGFDGSPALSADGLDLYFFSTRPGGPGGRDLWLASRASASATFSFPTPIENVSSTALEGGPRIRADGLALRFVSTRGGSADIWQAVRDSTSDDFNAAQPMTDLNTAKREEGITFSSDDLTVYFTSDRDGNAMDVWRARRDTTDDPFGTAELVTRLSSSADDLDLALSSDDQQLMMASERNGALRLFQANWACD
jgi:Tol biopolymer transport system component